MTPEIPIEGKIAAVKAAGCLDIIPDANETKDEAWDYAYSRLTPAEQALAVVCPVHHVMLGEICNEDENYPAGGIKRFPLPPCKERIALVSGDAAVPMQLSGVCSEHGHFHGASCRKCVVPEDVRIPSNRVSPADMERLMKLNDGIQQEESAREKVELPKLNVTEADKEEAYRLLDLYPSEQDDPWQFLACTRRQLLAALEEIKELKEESKEFHDQMCYAIKSAADNRERAESAEARVRELEEAEENRRVTLHKKFGFVPSKDGLKKCACAYCVRDFEAVADHAADLEMSDFSKGERITALESVVVELAKAGEWTFNALELLAAEKYPDSEPKMRRYTSAGQMLIVLSNPIVVELLKGGK